MVVDKARGGLRFAGGFVFPREVIVPLDETSDSPTIPADARPAVPIKTPLPLDYERPRPIVDDAATAILQGIVFVSVPILVVALVRMFMNWVQ